MDNLAALLVLQSKYLKIADYALQQLDTIQAAIKLVENEAAEKSVGGKIDKRRSS